MFDPIEILLQLEAEITDNMTRLLAKGALPSAEWQAAKLAEVGAFRADNIATVEKYLREVRAGMLEYYTAIGTGAVMEAGIPGLSSVLPAGVSATLARVWSIWETQTMNQLRNLGMTLIDGAQETYINIVYKSAAKMLAGSTTMREAIAETAAGWLEGGLPGLVDKGGKTWSVEGYAQVVLRSNETQVAKASQDAAFDEFDIDLVEISSHLGARERCAPFQGKVYSRSGRSSKYPALSSTSMGEAAGLFGCQCGHLQYAYNPAVGKTYRPYNVKENAESYADSQEQRRLERRIRAAKRKLSAGGIDPGGKIEKRAQKQLADAQADMRQFIDDTGRTRRRDREQIY